MRPTIIRLVDAILRVKQANKLDEAFTLKRLPVAPAPYRPVTPVVPQKPVVPVKPAGQTILKPPTIQSATPTNTRNGLRQPGLTENVNDRALRNFYKATGESSPNILNLLEASSQSDSSPTSYASPDNIQRDVIERQPMTTQVYARMNKRSAAAKGATDYTPNEPLPDAAHVSASLMGALALSGILASPNARENIKNNLGAYTLGGIGAYLGANVPYEGSETKRRLLYDVLGGVTGGTLSALLGSVLDNKFKRQQSNYTG